MSLLGAFAKKLVHIECGLLGRMAVIVAILFWDDQFEGFATAANTINRDSLIERCQFATFLNGQSQQVHIRDLGMCNDRIGLDDLKDADIFSPEVMAWRLTQLAKDGKHGGDVPGPIWVVRVAGNAGESILGDRTACPGLLTIFGEPAMG
jgi:hypothetical protein